MEEGFAFIDMTLPDFESDSDSEELPIASTSDGPIGFTPEQKGKGREQLIDASELMIEDEIKPMFRPEPRKNPVRISTSTKLSRFTSDNKRSIPRLKIPKIEPSYSKIKLENQNLPKDLPYESVWVAWKDHKTGKVLYWYPGRIIGTEKVGRHFYFKIQFEEDGSIMKRVAIDSVRRYGLNAGDMIQLSEGKSGLQEGRNYKIVQENGDDGVIVQKSAGKQVIIPTSIIAVDTRKLNQLNHLKLTSEELKRFKGVDFKSRKINSEGSSSGRNKRIKIEAQNVKSEEEQEELPSQSEQSTSANAIASSSTNGDAFIFEEPLQQIKQEFYKETRTSQKKRKSDASDWYDCILLD